MDNIIDSLNLPEDSIECSYFDTDNLSSLFGNPNDLNLNIIHQNIRSVYKNLEQFLLNLDNLNVQIIVLTETWITECSDWIQIPGYNSFHSVRAGKGGGVTILVKDFFECKLIEKFQINNRDIECVGVELSLPSSKYYIIGVYRSPTTSVLSNFNDTFFPLINSEIGQKKCVILGDFNINSLNVDLNIYENNFFDNLISENMVPLINIPTRIMNGSETCIDHIYTNAANVSVSGVIDLGVSDHYCTFCKIPFMNDKEIKKNIKFRIHSESNLQNFKNELARALELFHIYESLNIDDQFSIFTNILKNKYEKHCPIKSKTISDKQLKNPWITREIKTILDEKHRLRKLAHNNPNPENKSRYTNYNNFLNDKIKTSKDNYLNRKFETDRNDPKKTWKHINRLIKTNLRSKNIELKVNGTLINNPIQVAEKFNEYFSTIAAELDGSIPSSNQDPISYLDNHASNFVFNLTTPQEIINCINSFKSKSSPIDQIPSFVYKHIAEIISPYVSSLINHSVQNGVFPACLKLTRVTPVFKKGERSDVKNYRPISTQIFLSKIYERIMQKRLVAYCDEFSLIYHKQFGFQKNKSTSDAILLFTEQCYQSLENRNNLISIYLDFSKAFDTVNHEILTSKLRKYGFRGSINKWFASYLCDRFQYVDINGCRSTPQKMEYGVPQGSILGPLLFLLYINDMNKATNLELILFADDSTAIASGPNLQETISNIDEQLINLHNWLRANRLSLNVSKSIFSLFTNHRNIETPHIRIGSSELSYSSCTKYLGMQIDDKLNFSQHIKAVCKLVRNRTGLLKRLSSSIPKNVLRNLYSAIIYPHISRDIETWGNSSSTDLRRLRSLMDKCIKIISGTNTINDNSYKSLNLLKFDDVYSYFCLVRFYKYYRLEYSEYFEERANSLEIQHTYSTRSSTNQILNQPNVRLNRTSHSFFKNAILKWNSLPSNLRNITKLDTFKINLKKNLINQYR